MSINRGKRHRLARWRLWVRQMLKWLDVPYPTPEHEADIRRAIAESRTWPEGTIRHEGRKLHSARRLTP